MKKTAPALWLINPGRARERGSASVVMVFVVLVFLAQGFLVMGHMNRNLKSANRLAWRTQAYYAAEAGLLDGVAKLRQTVSPGWYADNKDAIKVLTNQYLPTGGMTSGYQANGFNHHYIIRYCGTKPASEMPDNIAREIYLVSSRGFAGAGKTAVTLQEIVSVWTDTGGAHQVEVLSRRERKG